MNYLIAALLTLATSAAIASDVPASCTGCSFAGRDLRGADLANVKYAGVNLSHANLRDAEMRGARLAGVDLYAADLRGANLSKPGSPESTFAGAVIGRDLYRRHVGGSQLARRVHGAARHRRAWAAA